MDIQPLILDENNEEVFDRAIRGALCLRLDGGSITEIPDHIKAYSTDFLLQSYNQRPLFYLKDMITVLELLHPTLVSNNNGNVDDQISKQVTDFYGYLTQLRDRAEVFYTPIHREAEVGVTYSGWGETEFGE